MPLQDTPKLFMPDYADRRLKSAIVPIAYKGVIRGVVTTDAIEAGTLVLVSKSIAFGFKDMAENVDVSRLQCTWRLLQSILAEGRGADAAHYLVSASGSKLWDAEVDLQAGKLMKKSHFNASMIDMFSLYKMVANCAYGPSLHGLASLFKGIQDNDDHFLFFIFLAIFVVCVNFLN